MTPFFLITTPRSRGTLLMRMLDASPGVSCAGESTPFLEKLRKIEGEKSAQDRRHAALSWPMHQCRAETGPWENAVASLLATWVNPSPSGTHYGVRSSYLGKEGWTDAVDKWSWLLKTWPDAKIVFLGRDQGEIELSMLATSKLWRPLYGTCPGVCGAKVKQHLQSMRDFHDLNPSRTVYLDAADLLDFGRVSAALESVGIPIDRDAWEAELATVSGTRREAYANEDSVKAPPSVADAVFSAGSVAEAEAILSGKLPDLEVHTLRFGKPPWMRRCAKSLESWCRRHGYAVKVHAPDPADADEKFSTLRMMREFLAGPSKRMLFIDADVFVHREAPAFPLESGFSARPDVVGKTTDDFTAWLEEHSLQAGGWTYCNSGVWSCDREAALAFLEAATGPHRTGYREQHQFNHWWHTATAAGMGFRHLPPEWNLLAGVEHGPAWFFHLAGRHKVSLLRRLKRDRLLDRQMTEVERFEAWKADPFGDKGDAEAIAAWKPEKPWKVAIMEPRHERAIVMPWLSRAAAWGENEILHALRSWHFNFEDRDCPIYILADLPPSFVRPGGRVRYLPVSYSLGATRALRKAFTIGLQLADEVIWTNDDFYLLEPCGWDDLRTALHVGRLDVKAAGYLEAGDGWLRTLGTVCRDLQKAGVKEVWNFATHTPFLFEREKAVEVLQRFHLRFRGSFENLYHNWHQTPHKAAGSLRTTTLPAEGARFLYHHDRTLTDELKAAIAEWFVGPAPWEMEILTPP